MKGPARRKAAHRRGEAAADARMVELCRQLRSIEDLEAVLDAEPSFTANPDLKAQVRRRIQEAVPHLRPI